MADQQWIAPGEHGFLVGETLYMRPTEIGDAQYPGAWHASPFPISRERAEQILTGQFPASAGHQNRLIACRRADDVPVGSLTYGNRHARTTHISIHVDPTLRGRGGSVASEIIGIAVPWLCEQGQYMVLWLPLNGPAPDIVAAVEAVGMRPAVRLREAVLRAGARHDQIVYELIHSGWGAKLGDPGPGISTEEQAADARRQSARRVSVANPAGPIPENALLVSERLALRMTEADDWIQRHTLLRRETETFFDRAQWLPSPLEAHHTLPDSYSSSPPDQIWLSVILRETGAVIGQVILVDVELFHRTAETGSMIFAPEWRGQGLGTEAKFLLLEFAFDWLSLHLLKSLVWGPNTRSVAALRKQGFRPAGSYRWDGQTGTEFVDTLVFDLLASEWREWVGPPTS